VQGEAQARRQPDSKPVITEPDAPKAASTGPASTGPASPGPASAEPASTGQLNAQIEACVVELTGRIISQAERIAERLSVPAIFIKVLHTLDAPMAMKDLGKRMHCDPSFVTAIADMLEKRGLARRTAHPGDRRIKRLILTSEGCDLRQRLEAEVSARMPWSNGLTDAERVQLLALIRKMLNATPPASEPAPGGADPGLAAATLSATTLSAAGLDPADPAATPAGSSAPAREVEASLGAAPTAG
jgi:MarR family transcriptional regulator, organic hydroperoxide resistance regulator